LICSKLFIEFSNAFGDMDIASIYGSFSEADTLLFNQIVDGGE
jgi:hypothetical protein